MRMIEEMAKMLAKVLFLRDEEKPEEALNEVENAYRTTIGIDPLLLDSLSVESGADLLGMKKDASAAGMKCLIAGRLYKAKGDILELNDQEKAAEAYHRALEFYCTGLLNINYSETDLSSFHEDLAVVENRLGGALDDETAGMLLKYHERNGQTGKEQV